MSLTAGFNAGGLEDRSRSVTAVCAAPSGMLLLDGPPDRLAPRAPVFPDLSSNRVLSVLQTPSGLLPPEGRLWSAAATGGWHTVAWEGLMPGRRAEAKADLQCRLHPDGDFEYFIRSRPGSDLSAVTNWLIGARGAGGGDVFAFSDTTPVSTVLPADGATLALRWTALGRLDPAVPDTDGDGLTDWEELMVYRTGLRRWDTDGDGLGDGDEVLKYGTDPLSPDSLGDGTNDFWRVVDAALLASAPSPWMEGGEGLALLTLESRLEGGDGLAALRIGDVVVPVRPGTAEVSRVAIPQGVDVPFVLAPHSGTSADDAAVTVVGAAPIIVALDADNVFRVSAPAGGFKRGSMHGFNYVLSPVPFCPHTGNDTLRAEAVGKLPAHVAAFGFGTAPDVSPTYSVSEAYLKSRFPHLAATPGAHTVQLPVRLGVVLTAGSAKAFGEGADTVPAHLCVLYTGGDGGGPTVPPGECPCCPGQTCPCRCESPDVCGCEACRNGYHVDAPTNSAGQAAGTVDRPHRLLLAGGAPDSVAAAPAQGGGISPLDNACTLCGCTQTVAGGGSPLPAEIYRRTAHLSAAPAAGFASTAGVFTVTGTAPGDRVGEDVFTWTTGRFFFSRGRYTVVGLDVCLSNAPAGAPPRVQAGHTNILIVTTRIPTNSAGTVLFSGHAAGASAAVRNRLTGQHEPLQGSYEASGWLSAYAGQSRTAEVRYAADATGPHGLTVTYAQPDTLPGSVSTNLAFEAIRILSEPVTAAADPAGHVVNPGGMPLGGTGHFKVEVADGAVPDADITWTVKSGAGRVAFAGGSAGPDVTVNAAATGTFTLEADVRGLVITPPHVRPHFSGAVLPAVTVPVTVWIVRKEDGLPIREPTTIPELLTDANRILWQNGLTLVQSGSYHLLNNTNWLNHIDVVNPANTNLSAMLNTTNSMGNAVELYFVNMLEGGDAAGVRWPEGIAIAAGGDAHTVAHEILHDCGLEDIYAESGEEGVLLEALTQQGVPADWGGGYYHSWLIQRDVIKRLVMRSNLGPLETGGTDLPTGDVRGWHHSAGSGESSIILGPAKVGQSSIIRTPGSY